MAKKISVVSEIKGYSKKVGKGMFSISIGTVKLSDSNRNLLDGVIDNKDKVKISIELVEPHLPNME